MNQALDANLKMQNTSNNFKQIQRLQERYKNPQATKPRAHRLASSAEARSRTRTVKLAVLERPEGMGYEWSVPQILISPDPRPGSY